ncbi:MAG TPA: hypothetical protein VGO66_05475 [Solirubrobacterales bacterium]|jgi:hypothetical protein|nr:hypothetical protein [Solirubrobacterales bacterium]
MRFERPDEAPIVLVTAVARAEGARAAAAALTCAVADIDRAALLVDMGGRPPRPTLIASEAARGLEERLTVHLPETRVAARGQVCHLAVPTDPDGIAAAAAAVTVARGAVSVLHIPPTQLQAVLAADRGPSPSAVLLRADLADDRALVALVARDLIGRGLRVAVLKHPLGWVASRRALFGVLGDDAAAGLPTPLLRQLTSHKCYADLNDPKSDPARAKKPERRDHESTRSR